MPGSYVKIQSVTVTGATAANMEFTNIPGTFDDIVVLISARTNRTVYVGDALLASFNGSTSNFTGRYLIGDGSSVSSGTDVPRYFGAAPTSAATTSTFGNVLVYIPNYAGSTNKSFSVDSVTEHNGTDGYQTLIAGLWSNTAAITSITITPNIGTALLQHSSATLYGIKRN
jgi:hypothetical protein